MLIVHRLSKDWPSPGHCHYFRCIIITIGYLGMCKDLEGNLQTHYLRILHSVIVTNTICGFMPFQTFIHIKMAIMNL